jgi:hypothetical protein
MVLAEIDFSPNLEGTNVTERMCARIIGHIQRFEIAGFSYLQLCYFVHLFIRNTVWRSTSSPTRAPWALGKPTRRANIMTIIIAASTRLWRNHESITFYEVRSHWWWSIPIAWWEWLLEGSRVCVFPAECTSVSFSIGMLGGWGWWGMHRLWFSALATVRYSKTSKLF